MSRRIWLSLTVAALGILGPAATAVAAPLWDAEARWGNANLAPGAHGRVVIKATNFGSSASSGTVTVTNVLPPGVRRVPPTGLELALNPKIEGDGWTCTDAFVAGIDTVTCTTNTVISQRTVDTDNPGSGYAERVLFNIKADPAAVQGVYDSVITISGGGGASQSIVEPMKITTAPTTFGAEDGSFETDAFKDEAPDQRLERQANSHPFELRVRFDLKLKRLSRPSSTPGLPALSFTVPADELKTVYSTLPRGLIGNPEALPKCTMDEFLETPTGGGVFGTGCPPETQVGIVSGDLAAESSNGGGLVQHPGAFSRIPLYNLEPRDGVPADFAFRADDFRGHVFPNVDPANQYAIAAVSPYVSSFLQTRGVSVAIWGVPGDPAHNHLRYDVAEGGFGASFDGPIRPLMTLGGECGTAYTGLLRLESWQNAGTFTPNVEAVSSMTSTGCDDPRIRFNPQVNLKPTSLAASGPTGLAVNLVNPQREDTVSDAKQLYAENGDFRAIATPPIKKAEVTLPEGVTVSTSAAQGLGSCSSAQIGIGTNDPVSCPENSQYGTLTIETPMLTDPLKGRLYLASQFDNPFNSFLALYLVVEDPKTGILVKLPAKVDLDHGTGQIKTTFDDLPQFPVASMQLALKGGIRAALVNPSTCGTKTIRAELTSWSDPGNPVVVESSYEIKQKADGSPCVKDPAERPFAPQVEAGTLSSSAGTYSPFVFRLTRTDDDQEITSLAAKLPKGLIAKVAGISQCGEEAIASADRKTGAEEQASPSCPASSYLGVADVGSGVGQVLTFVQGKAYLSGPYKGAPLSMVVITPVVAGPYDLGTIAVRTALKVDTTTAQVEVETDPFPQMFEGIPVRIKDIRIKVDRPEGTINPTSCDPMAIEARIGGVGGDLFSAHDDVFTTLSTPFQASNCAALGFRPGVSFELKGGTKRGQFPAMVAKLRARPGDANIKSAQVTLPRTAFLEQGHIRTICTRVQFAAKACPEGSVIGHAKATSPLIDGALEGPVVMRSSNNKLPDLVATLDGLIEVSVASRIDSFKRRIRASFDSLPDVPVDSFELRMQGGKKGLIVNSADLCRVTSRAGVKLGGQNGAEHNFKPKVKATGCKGKARKKNKKQKAKK